MTPPAISLYSATDPSPINGTRTLLMGPPGSGKTTALRSWFELEKKFGLPPGTLKMRVVALDPNVWPILGSTPAAITHLRTSVGWKGLKDMAKSLHSLNNEQLQKETGWITGNHEFVDLVNRMTNFVDTAGNKHGCCDTWGTDTLLVIDGLSGLSDLVAQAGCGHKLAWTQPDWQKTMSSVGQFLKQITRGCFCHIIVVAHVEYETDVFQVPKIMASTLGRKLAPTIGKDFTDVVYVSMKGGVFSWSTANPSAELKAMHLPFKDNLEPTLEAILTTPEKGWLARGGVFSPVVPAVWSEPDYYKS